MRTRILIAVVGALALAAFLGPHGDTCCPVARAESGPTRPTAATKSVVLHVEGMTCASCSVTVKLVLKKLDGVKTATISVADKRAVIEYDPAKVKPEQMVEAVNKTGYSAKLAPDQKGS